MEERKTNDAVSTILTARQEWLKRELAWRMRRQMTPSERRLWQHLRGSRVQAMRFYRQQVIEGFIADFYCDAARLVVEVDGAVHDRQTEYDAERTRIFHQLGLLVLRFTNAQVDDETYATVAAIRAACRVRV